MEDKIVYAKKGEKATLANPSKEAVAIVVDKENQQVLYRLKSAAEDILIEGSVKFDFEGDKLSNEALVELRDKIIADAKEKIKERQAVNDFKLAELLEENIKNVNTKLDENTIYISAMPKPADAAADHTIAYGVMLAKGLKCTSVNKITVKTKGGETQEAIADLVKKAVQEDLAKKKFKIINGQEIVGEIAEELGKQPNAGYNANFKGQNPRHLQLKGCVRAAQKEGVDIIAVTENSDFDPTVKMKAQYKDDLQFSKDVNYPAIWRRHMEATCVAMNTGAEPVLEPMPKRSRVEKAPPPPPLKKGDRSVTRPLPKFEIGGFAVAGVLIGLGVAVAVMGLVWPVALVALAAGIVFGGGRALYEVNQRFSEAATAFRAFNAEEVERRGSEHLPPSSIAAKAALANRTGEVSAPPADAGKTAPVTSAEQARRGPKK
jgi:hypothetical protein